MKNWIVAFGVVIFASAFIPALIENLMIAYMLFYGEALNYDRTVSSIYGEP